MERLRKVDEDLVYRCAKPYSEPASDRRDPSADELTLMPLELIERITALVPPPRTHRHRYYGVLAPNSPLRSVVTAMPAQQALSQAWPTYAALTCSPAQTSAGESATAAATLASAAISPESEPQPMAPKRSPAHYLWAALIARIYEVFPLLCPICGGQMRIIAFITHSAEIRQILDHIGVDSEPPRLSQARGPPLWEADAQWGEGGQALPDWDLQAQSAPDYEVDQRLSW